MTRTPSKTAASKASSPSAVSFSGTLERIGVRTIVRLPDEASAALPSRGQVAVHGTANDTSFETVVEPDGRRGHWLRIDDKLGKALDPGKSIKFAIERSADWPEPEVPTDLQSALDDAADTAESWSDITPMARWEWVRWVGATKNPQTRARRVAVTISKLGDGKRRPCCFDLASCTDPEVAKSGKLIETPGS